MPGVAWRSLALRVCLAALIASVPVAVSADNEPELQGVPLSVPTKGTLAALQENWLQWDSAFLRGDEAGAETAVSDLRHTAGELGMTRLPDVSMAVLARAVDAAASGNAERARWAVDMGEELDPGRPEAAMAAAAVARYEGRFVAMLWHELRGYARMVDVPAFSVLTRENLLLWLLAAVVVAGALFVSLQLASYGAWLIGDLAADAGRWMPVPTAYFLALVIVILPILIPSAWIALPFYWLLLLAGYARRRERVVAAVVLAVILLSPLVLWGQAERLRVELSDGMRAARSMKEGRLYGALFRDLADLQKRLPEEPAVRHLIGDVHQKLGQLEYARLVYEEVVDAEPTNYGAHNNLGIYYLGQRNTGKAIEHFERAVALTPEDRLEPHRNLYLLYRDYLAFEEAERVLADVRRRDPAAVVSWVQDGPGSVTPVQEGLQRPPEIARALRRSPAVEANESASRLSRARVALPSVVFLVVALALVARLYRRGAFRQWRPVTPSGRFAAWIPGLPSIRDDRGYRAYGALLVFALVLLVPRIGDIGLPLPWGIEPGRAIVWLATAMLLAMYFAVRWLMARGEASGVD